MRTALAIALITSFTATATAEPVVSGPPGEARRRVAPGTTLIFESQATMARRDAARLRHSGYKRVLIGSLLTLGGVYAGYEMTKYEDTFENAGIQILLFGAGVGLGTAGLATLIGGTQRIRNANKREANFIIGPIEGGAAAMLSGSF